MPNEDYSSRNDLEITEIIAVPASVEGKENLAFSALCNPLTK